METSELINHYLKHPSCKKLNSIMQDENIAKIHLRGLHGSSRSLVAASAIPMLGGMHLMVEPGRDDAAYLYNDLVHLLGPENILFFPSSKKKSIVYHQIDSGNVILRTNLLNRLDHYKTSEKPEPFLIFVCCIEGLSEKVISGSKLKKNTFQLTKGEKINPRLLLEVLDTNHFDIVDFVYEPGQYSIRGSIIDIFSFSNPDPYRIDFFGDEVESIRTFDIETQLSQQLFERINIIPDPKKLISEDTSESLLDYLDLSAVIWIDHIRYATDRLNEIYEQVCSMQTVKDEEVLINEQLITTGYEFQDKIRNHRVIEFASQRFYSDAIQLDFHTTPQPAFNKNFNLLAENIMQHIVNGYTIYILSDSEKQSERLTSIFHDIDRRIRFQPVLKALHKGFIDRDVSICCYTDHQIFERYHKYSIQNYFSTQSALTIKELSGLQPGDYVVHIDHGIGVFGGLEKIVNNGKIQESIRLVYKDHDMLYVSIHSLHRISKYKGKDNEPPKLHKLGSYGWQKLKLNTKNKIKDIARELISLYAKRKMHEGFVFSPDSYLQTELEASFVYEDTPDQLKTTWAIKEDMESRSPMDRLVCGDVGFGKTEIAIRAAFKAVADSKQVALLVPTTILALQHYNTFRERLKDFPCNVEYINRFKKGHQQTEIIRTLESGKTDVIIGTHRLLGSDVKFKDLGLLIVDEEQKFGVSAKEKLRNLKLNVDTLTLTATPIPRTLQFSLMGIRDLSVINTPPPNRYPIVTEMHPFNEEIIREGIEFEILRGGQVFFIHNRVQNIQEVASLIHKICPHVSICIAHGQMRGRELEKNMTDFIRGDYDVLVATAIIESGLDIPNANTIFVNNAHHFGLSGLHQLRGRVGRSNKKAFCYLLAPAPSLITAEARKRLKAIEEFSELGSGFNIALQDLDIRGAGNMLGAEQSGFIADVGFETYNHILNEAIQELRENEFPDLEIRKNDSQFKQSPFVSDCQIDTDLELLFPDEYISNTTERMHLYRELDQIRFPEELHTFKLQLIDRFGPIPEPAGELLKVMRLRWLAIKLGFEKLILKNTKMIGHFVANQLSAYYTSEVFSHILSYIQKHPSLFRMKEGKNKLTLTSEPIGSVQEAIDVLDKLTVTVT